MNLDAIGYAHRLRVTRPSTTPVLQDPETGAFTPAAAQVICTDAVGDWQDGVESRSAQPVGREILDYQAVWFFQDEALLDLILPNDVFVVTHPAKPIWSREGEVKGKRELDGALEMRVR